MAQPWLAPPLTALILGSNEALKTSKMPRACVCVCPSPHNDESACAQEESLMSRAAVYPLVLTTHVRALPWLRGVVNMCNPKPVCLSQVCFRMTPFPSRFPS